MGTKLLKRNPRTGTHYSVPLVSLRGDTTPMIAIAPGLDVVTWNTPLSESRQQTEAWLTATAGTLVEAREEEEEEDESWTIR